MKNKTHKIQFSFHHSSVRLIERLMEEREAPSKAEIIRDALAVFEWVHDKVRKGYNIMGEKDGVCIAPEWKHIFPDGNSISPKASKEKWEG